MTCAIQYLINLVAFVLDTCILDLQASVQGSRHSKIVMKTTFKNLEKVQPSTDLSRTVNPPGKFTFFQVPSTVSKAIDKMATHQGGPLSFEAHK